MKEGADLTASRQRSMKESGAGANFTLMRVEDCSLHIEDRHNFVDTW
jgi:hypothetical protein